MLVCHPCQSDFSAPYYFGLAPKFISWYAVAQEAVKQTGSISQINLEDKGWSDDGLMWDVSDMKNDFGLESDPWDKIVEHVAYYIDLLKGT